MYAAAASSSPKPTTMLEDKLGELASNYKLSSETIEEAHSFGSSTSSWTGLRAVTWPTCGARSATSPVRSSS